MPAPALYGFLVWPLHKFSFRLLKYLDRTAMPPRHGSHVRIRAPLLGVRTVRVWALSISHQGRCRAWYSRSCMSLPRDALCFHFFSRATHSPQEIMPAHGLYMVFDLFRSYLLGESAKEADLGSRGAMFAVGSRLRAELIYRCLVTIKQPAADFGAAAACDGTCGRA